MKHEDFKNTNLILITARKNSKSIKNKNIKLFCGKPLIYWTIKVALQSNLGRVCVSTDCNKIKNYALSLGADVPFLRPKNIAQDKTPSELVIEHALNFYKKKNVKFKFFFYYNPLLLLEKYQILLTLGTYLKKIKNVVQYFRFR